MATPGPDLAIQFDAAALGPPWGMVQLNDCWHDQHRDLAYIHEPFNNTEDVASWRFLGFTQSRFTGDMYDMRFAEPSCVADVRQQVPLKHFAWSFYRMCPGDVIPEHRDTFARFKKIHALSDSANICRFVVFLEDWNSGHYFEIDGCAVTMWRRGQAVYFFDQVRHMAANLGSIPRYTLQITGVV